MTALFRGASTRPVWLAILLLAALGLYLADARLHLLESARTALLTLLEPLQRIASFPGQVWGDTRESLRSRDSLEQEIERLRAENKLLQAQMQTFWSVEQENKRLRTALHAIAPLDMDVMLAQVLRDSAATENPTLLINRGKNDGVYVGQAVLLGTGVFGQVVHLGANTAEVLPLTDEQHSIPVRVARSGQRGIVRGIGSAHEVSVHHLPKQADVQVGDLLLTSGLGGRFPEGFPVASVTHIGSGQSGAFVDVRARPMAEIDDVRDVVLVWMRETQPPPSSVQEPPPLANPLPTDIPPPAASAVSSARKQADAR
ncbi:MAG: rod shape-determining protein MreC [Pseudomonadota bacterium]